MFSRNPLDDSRLIIGPDTRSNALSTLSVMCDAEGTRCATAKCVLYYDLVFWEVPVNWQLPIYWRWLANLVREVELLQQRGVAWVLA